MRILTITNWYPPHHYGGYELSCYDVMTRLERRGHAVEVLCSTHRRAGTPPSTEHERHVRRELEMYLSDGTPARLSPRKRLAIERHNQRVLAATLDELNPDVVSVWHMGALSVGLLTTIAERGIPIVYAICDDWLTYCLVLDQWARMFHGSALRTALGRVVRPLVRLPTTAPHVNVTGAFCFVSQFTQGRAERLSPWTSFPISAVVYSGIERAAFPSLSEPPRRPWRWRLVYLGRFDPRKGLETLIRAMVQLPADASLALYGHDREGDRARWQSLVSELGLSGRVSFGVLERDELAAALSDADALVFPTVWEEPFGLVPVEAMACGTPVIATGRGGSAEFLADGVNCVLFEAGDAAALAGAVRRLAGDPALRQRLVATGFRTADELTTDRLADEFERWHEAAARRFTGELPPSRNLPSAIGT
jgi:glycosyltransferase involved in cell wall biosynthesis